jgi:hypothetical protein
MRQSNRSSLLSSPSVRPPAPSPRLHSSKCKETFSFVLFVMFRVSLVPGVSFLTSSPNFERRGFALRGIFQARNPFERRGFPVPDVMSSRRDDPAEGSKKIAF